MEVVGFILVGIFIGACLFTLVSIWTYSKSCPSYTEKETDVGWHLKAVAVDAYTGKKLYIMQSTKTAEVLAMDTQGFNNRFRH